MVKRAANAFNAVLKSGQIHFRAAAEAGPLTRLGVDDLTGVVLKLARILSCSARKSIILS
jgi:hypothetical protein